MKYNLFLFYLMLIFVLSSCQTKQSFIDDIPSLCKEIGLNHTIVGLGESTHGTKEFTEYRAEIVRELVTNYDFRIFILEAEYLNCKNMNDYILNGLGNAENSLDLIDMWPWNNQDFLELMQWLRTYNLSNPDDQVQFFGMDAQMYQSYLTTVKYNFPQEFKEKYVGVKQDSILKYYPSKGQELLLIEQSDKSAPEKILELRDLSDKWVGDGSKIDLNLVYYIQTRIHNHSYTEPKDLNVRDENMAKLIDLIYKKYGKKIILWAHNDHVFRKYKTESDFISLGHHVSEIYKDAYGVVGFDFSKGSFRAISRDESNRDKMEIFEYKQVSETLSSQIDFKDKSFKIQECSTLNTYYNVNCIGASYKSNFQDKKRYISQNFINRECDYIFHVLESSPSDFLGSYN